MTPGFDSARVDALVEAAGLLHGATDVEQLLQHLLRSAMAHVLARRGFVAVGKDDAMRFVQVRGIAQSCPAGSPYSEEQARAAGIDALVPIGRAESPVGWLGVGATAAPIGSEHEQFLAALAGISAGAIENVRYSAEVRHLNQRLDRKLQELRTLLDLVRGLTAVVEPEQVAQMLALTLAGQFAVSRYAVVAWKEGHPTVIRARGAKIADPAAVESLVAPLPDAATIDGCGKELGELLRAQKIAAVVPIRTADATVGAVLLGARPSGVYTTEMLEYIRGLADQAAVAFENAWHFRETLEKKKIEKELELAADIQRRLLPAAFPSLAGLEVAASTRPARQVGGDYYDVVQLPSGETLFCVADVSGKGVAASLLMSNFQASLRALASAGQPLAEIVTRMNALMHASTAANKYVTSIFLRIDADGRAAVVNAGHNDGIVLHADGTAERLKASGLAVGLMPGRTYTESDLRIGPGDVIALYSDGVTEANDPNEEELGIDRLIDVMRANATLPAAGLVDAIAAAVDAFASTAPQYDDITIMVIRRGG